MHQEVLLPASKPGRPLLVKYGPHRIKSQWIINVILIYDSVYISTEINVEQAAKEDSG